MVKSIKSEEYNLEHTDGKPLYLDLPALSFTLPFCAEIPVYKQMMIYFENNQIDWVTSREDIQKIATTLLELDSKEGYFFVKLHSKWKEKFAAMQSLYQELFNKDFKILEDLELKKILTKYIHFYLHTLKFPSFLDAYMFYADKKLQELLEDFSAKTKGNANILFNVLSAPTSASFLSQAEENLRKIGKEKDKLEKHCKEYSYLSSSYLDYKEYKPKAVKNIKLKNIELKYQQEKKKELLRKYHFSTEILQIVRLTELFMLWQDERKVMTLTHIALDYKFAEEISKRNDLTLENLKFSTYEELVQILNGNNLNSELERRRKQPFLAVYKQGKVIERKYNQEARKLILEMRAQKEEVTKIKGFTACLGKAQGKVHIINSTEDIKNFKQGEILVISMTRPEHTPAMKLSAGIVTNEGGITCHAAILSREMKKPCIIGTKIATQVLKDGDLVEVDADKGIVRKIKKKI